MGKFSKMIEDSEFKNLDQHPEKFESDSFENFTQSRKDRRKSSSFDSKTKVSSNGFVLHKVQCDACKRDCDVPFEPKNRNKPVYCRSCFRKGVKATKEFEQKNSKYSSVQVEEMNNKLDKIMKVLKVK